jgi:uncharacterized protein (TIGR03437 family)
MKRFAILLLLAGFAEVQANSQPTIGSVVNGASFAPSLSPGCLISIFGTALAPELAGAVSLPLPTQLAGTSVNIDGVAAPLYFVSAGQINAQIPFGITKSTITLTVTSSTGTSAPYALALKSSSPGIFSKSQDGKGSALSFDGSFHELTAIGSEAFILYATGLGATDPPAVAGEPGASVEPLNRIAGQVEVYVGDVKAEVQYAGLAPGFVGVYQINVQPPANPTTNRLVIRLNGGQGNLVDVPIPAGTVQASGSITPVYPTSTGGPISISAVPTIARFSVSFRVPNDGKVHSVAATAEGGKAVITFQPDGQFLGALTDPVSMARAWDFSSGAIGMPVDFMPGCSTTFCYPAFPGGMVPLSRVDPQALEALQQLPLPNAIGDPTNGVFMMGGTFTPGELFVIDSQTHSEMSMFGGFFNLAPPVGNTASTAFKLYVDSALVAEQSVDYAVVGRH